MASTDSTSPAAALAALQQLVLFKLRSSLLALFFAAIFYVRALRRQTRTVVLTPPTRRELRSRSRRATFDGVSVERMNRCLCDSMSCR